MGIRLMATAQKIVDHGIRLVIMGQDERLFL
jgi:hypothetical protein